MPVWRGVASLTRWTAAGAAGLAGVFSIVAAHPHLPKVNLHAVGSQITGNQAPASGNVSTSGGAPGDTSAGATAGDDPGLEPPAQAPQATQAPAPQARSGAS